QVGSGIGQRFGLEPVGDATTGNAGVARGLNVHGAVADHEGAAAADAGLLAEGFHADGVGLLEVETIAAVDLEKAIVDTQTIDDRLADANRLVGEHRHALARRVQPVERFIDAGVEGGVIQVVLAVVLEKKLERFLDLFFAGLVSQRAPDQQRRAVAHIRVDPLIFERRHAHVAAGRVDGLGQVQFGIEQGAVEIENQKVHVYAAPVSRWRKRLSRATGLRRVRARRSPKPYST